jgi:hypothetical protein
LKYLKNCIIKNIHQKIGKHIANAIKEELKDIPTIANFATVQNEDELNPKVVVKKYLTTTQNDLPLPICNVS